MAEQPDVAEVVKDISSDISTIVKAEIELAKAELVPQVKRLGIGGALLGAAGVFALQAVTLLFVFGGLAFTALYWGRLTPVWAFALGFLTMAVLCLVLAGLLALIAKGRLKVSSPRRTIEQGQLTVNALTHAVSSGLENVKALAGRGNKRFATDGKGNLVTVLRDRPAPKDLDAADARRGTLATQTEGANAATLAPADGGSTKA